MARLMADPSLPQRLQRVRGAVAALQARLNREAAAKLEGLVAAAEGRPRHGGKHPLEEGEGGGGSSDG